MNHTNNNSTTINILSYLSVRYEKNWYKDLFSALVETAPNVTVFAIDRPHTLLASVFFLIKRPKIFVEKNARIVHLKPLAIVHERIACVIKPLAWLNKWIIEKQIYGTLRDHGKLKGINVSWVFHPYQYSYLDYLDPMVRIYQVYDDYYSVEKDTRVMHELESLILSKVDMVYLISKPLLPRYSLKHKNVKLMPNGASQKFIITGQQDHIFHQISNIKKPRICSWGYITDRLDYELILNLAKINPDWSFVFLGEAWKNLESKWEAIVNQCPNIFYFEKVNWQNLAVYLSAMDIMFIPHVKNIFNAASSPVRFMQALAMGKPLIVPDLPYATDCKNIIYYAETVDEYTAIIKKYLKVGEDPVLADRRRQYAYVNSWEEKAKVIMKDIAKCLLA